MMDQLDKRFLQDILVTLAVLVFVVFLYSRFSVPGVLLAGSLALTVFVLADIVLSRRG